MALLGRRFRRLAGVAGILGGLLQIAVSYLMWFVDETDRQARRFHEGPYEALLSIPILLFILLLLAVEMRQGDRSGRLGKGSLGLCVVALALVAMGATLTSDFMLLGLPLLVVGLTLFSVATIRANALPRWAARLPLVLALVFLISTVTGVLLPLAGASSGTRAAILMILSSAFGLGWVGLGAALYSEESRQGL